LLQWESEAFQWRCAVDYLGVLAVAAAGVEVTGDASVELGGVLGIARRAGGQSCKLLVQGNGEGGVVVVCG